MMHGNHAKKQMGAVEPQSITGGRVVVILHRNRRKSSLGVVLPPHLQFRHAEIQQIPEIGRVKFACVILGLNRLRQILKVQAVYTQT